MLPLKLSCISILLFLSSSSVDAEKNDAEIGVKRNLRQGGEEPPTEEAKVQRRGLFKRKKKSLAGVLFPGVAPEDYEQGQEIPIWVEQVESKKTQVPFKFYDLPGCTGPPVGKKIRKNLGAKLQGYNSAPSPYTTKVLENTGCTPICITKIASKKLTWMRKLVNLQYRIHLVLDQLPIVMRNDKMNYVIKGYPIGFKAPPSFTGLKEDEFYLYNHLRFSISYHEDPDSFEGVRIVGFEVHPVSVNHKFDKLQIKSGDFAVDSCLATESVMNDAENYLPLTREDGADFMEVMYSYEVEWKKSPIAWADRWDAYLIGNMDDEVHIFSIVNSLMIVLFLSGSIATVLLRTLRKDIAMYNELAGLEGSPEGETGWKLVHGDVFRPPKEFPMMLSVAVGTGVQIGSSIFLTILCSVMGILHHMNKGQTLTTIILLYVLTGTISGYVSSRLYKFFEATSWKKNTLLTAVAFPGLIVALFVSLNTFLALAGAATAVSFMTIVALFLLWICVSTPLVFVGSYFGYRADVITVPTKTNQIARFIPETPWHTKLPYSMAIGGILPFASICIELFFILGAIWLRHIYYLIGFLLAVVLILAVSCSEVAVIMVYTQLSSEDHSWWWKSFLNVASVGIYCFIYGLWFLSSKLDLVGVLPVMVYLTYMSMISLAIGLFCGSVGFLTCFVFNYKIYGAVKVD